jgi:Ca-activated chloride channel family protein
MRRFILALALLGLAGSPAVRAQGLLIPTDHDLPPLSLTSERVKVMIDGQVATTTVHQSYRNRSGRDLEAEFIFPLPPGASVRDFSMWVAGKRYKGEAVDASKARQTYEDIVRRLQDPGLLEYIGRDLWKARVYPVLRMSEQEIEITFTTILPLEADMVSYQYRVRADQTARSTVKDFTMVVQIQSPDALGPIYSPSHDVAIDRRGDRNAVVSFERNAYQLDKDFQLYFVPKAERIGASLLTHRTSPGEPGYFLLLLSPRGVSEAQRVPRDLVVVVDTSGSMDREKMRQAKAAVIRTLDSLGPDDRFALIAFATTPRSFREQLAESTAPNLRGAREWVEKLRSEGGTDISAALEAALKLRTDKQAGRTFQVVFLTDGLPTVGTTDPKKILEIAGQRTGEGTRIYTFGVGDDVDTQLLDSLAETTRGSSTYVRPDENLESKVSAFTAKIERPVRTNLELAVRGGPRLVEMYPPRIPDLFHGEQLQIVGRYEGLGRATLTLSGRAGDRELSESLETTFSDTAAEHEFIAPIWARRKVGYLLDQMRSNGESAEVKRELIRLAHDFSIATPYTSLLIVPETGDAPASGGRRPAVRRRRAAPRWSPNNLGFGAGMGAGTSGNGRAGQGFGGMTGGMAGMGGMGGSMGGMGGGMARMGGMGGSMAGMGGGMAGMGGMGGGMGGMGGALGGSMRGSMGGGNNEENAQANTASAPEPLGEHDPQTATTKAGLTAAGQPTSGKEAVDFAQRLAALKTGAQTDISAAPRTIAGRRFRKVGDAWVDQGFTSSTPTLRLRLLGKAYFRLLNSHPELGPVFALGKRITWVSPSGTAVIVDAQGRDDADEASLNRLFGHE